MGTQHDYDWLLCKAHIACLLDMTTFRVPAIRKDPGNTVRILEHDTKWAKNC